MYRFRDILCELPELQFMMADKNGTVVPHYVLFAIKDEHFEKDLQAAKNNYFDFARVYNPSTHETSIITLT